MQLLGLRLDDSYDIPVGTWKYAKNILVSKGFNKVEKDLGSTNLNIDLGLGNIVLGKIDTPKDIIYFVKEIDSVNSLYYFVIVRFNTQTETKTELLKIEYPIYPVASLTENSIEGIYNYNSTNDLIIAWTDTINPPMFLNCSKISELGTFTTDNDIEKLYLFPHFNSANIDLVDVTSGGDLLTGVYHLTVAYELEDDLHTNFGIISNPIQIIVDDVLKQNLFIEGCASGIPSGKTIIASISNLDNKYKKFIIGVIYRTEKNITTYKTESYYCSTTPVKISIDSLSNLTNISTEEVLVPNITFDKVQTMSPILGRLRIGGTENNYNLTLADVYNNIIPKVSIKWVADDRITPDHAIRNYKNPIITFKNKGFRDSEVYALYLGIRDKKGGYLGIYHIPGPTTSNMNDDITLTFANGTTSEVRKRYEVEDLTTIQSYPYSLRGVTGPWINKNEKYSNDFGIYAGQNVRHHKMPSRKKIVTATGAYSTTGTPIDEITTLTYKNSVTLGTITEVSFNHTSLLNYRFEGNHLYYPGNRVINYDATTINVTVTCPETETLNIYYFQNHDGTTTEYNRQDISVPAGGGNFNITLPATLIPALSNSECSTGLMISITSPDPITISFTGSIKANISIVTIGVPVIGLLCDFDADTLDSDIKALLDKYCDGFELFYAKRTINNMTILDQSVADIEVGYSDRFRFYGFDSMTNLLNIKPNYIRSELQTGTIDITTVDSQHVYNNITTYALHSSSVTKWSKVKTISYLPAFNSATVPPTTNEDNRYSVEIENAYNYNNHLVDLVVLQDDLYVNLDKQDLVSTGFLLKWTSNNISSKRIYGGDNFISRYSYLVYLSGTVYSVSAIIQSISNAGLRYSGELDADKFNPVVNVLTKVINEDTTTSYPYLDAFKEAGVVNKFIYNNDFNLNNDLRQGVIRINNNFESKFPNIIYSSQLQPLDNSYSHWRIFKPLDRYSLTNSKGAIFKFLSSEYILYIQTEYSIFRAIIKDSLKSDGVDISLKSVDIFETNPQDLFDAPNLYIKAYAKNLSKITPIGLVIVDPALDRIHVITDNDDIITSYGISNWIKGKLVNTCYIMFDENNDRLIFSNTTSDNDKYFALSYNYKQQAWISFHTPYELIKNPSNTFNGVYYLYQNQIYKLNNNPFKTGLIKPDTSVIDFVFTNEQPFLLEGIEFETESIQISTGVSLIQSLPKLMVYNKHQCTGLIDLVRQTLGIDSGNIIQTGNIVWNNNKWYFNDVVDNVNDYTLPFIDAKGNLINSNIVSKQWYDRNKFISKFAVVRLVIGQDNGIYTTINDVKLQAKVSKL